jgi:hypothetical protein
MMVPSTLLGYGKADMLQPLLDSVGGRMATTEEILANTMLPMAVAGITKRIIPSQARLRGLDWYSVDTGYFGNRASHKNWMRITRNEYQLSSSIRERPGERLARLKLDLTQFVRGRRIVVVPTHPKVCEAWQIGNHDAWLQSAMELIRRHTDRPIVVRERPASRYTRQYHDVFVDFIREDVHAVVAWTSNCMVEAAMHGIPVVSLGASAALQVSGKVENIDHLPNIDPDLQQAWLRHLSYAQFTKKEMQSGAAWSMLHE